MALHLSVAGTPLAAYASSGSDRNTGSGNDDDAAESTSFVLAEMPTSGRRRTVVTNGWADSKVPNHPFHYYI